MTSTQLAGRWGCDAADLMTLVSDTQPLGSLGDDWEVNAYMRARVAAHYGNRALGLPVEETTPADIRRQFKPLHAALRELNATTPTK